jgi:hypothetical protein
MSGMSCALSGLRRLTRLDINSQRCAVRRPARETAADLFTQTARYKVAAALYLATVQSRLCNGPTMSGIANLCVRVCKHGSCFSLQILASPCFLESIICPPSGCNILSLILRPAYSHFGRIQAKTKVDCTISIASWSPAGLLFRLTLNFKLSQALPNTHQLSLFFSRNQGCVPIRGHVHSHTFGAADYNLEPAVGWCNSLLDHETLSSSQVHIDPFLNAWR